MKVWSGLEDGNINEYAEKFNASISFDKELYKYDIEGSIAHAKMLSKCSIISKEDEEKIVETLKQILDEIDSKKLVISEDAEDIHSFVEAELTSRIGDIGKKVHTARSRNDQVALDLHLYLADKVNEIIILLDELIKVIVEKAKEYSDAICPGYTHLQRAQPIYYAHQILAYAHMLKRDKERLLDNLKRIIVSPIGSCALAGTTYNTDRNYEAKILGFEKIYENSIDAVSDRDFAIEFLSNASIIMMHLSRFSEELIIHNSFEFKFINLQKEFTTGSSIMPQKRNPDMAELTRGKTGRVYGNLMALLTIMKGLPLAYNKDMQEDKEPIFDTVNNLILALRVFAPMVKTLTVNKNKMLQACEDGFINATDCADYLVKKGLPFRDAYKIVGQIVNEAQKQNKNLMEFSLEDYKKFCELFDKDIYDEIKIENCVNKRISFGGTGKEAIQNQIKRLQTE